MERPLYVEEAVGKLIQIRGREINLVPVLQKFHPDHVHWKEEPWGFQTKPELYRWLFTWGLPHFAKQKLNPSKEMSPQESSKVLYEKFFGHHGITGKIEVPGEGLLDYHTGVRIDPIEGSHLWPARSVIRLFPEVDFEVGLDYPEADEGIRKKVQEEAFILLNTTKVGRERYKPHLLGYPLEGDKPKSLVHGQGYLRRLDDWLRHQGLEKGIQGVAVADESKRLIETFMEARVA